MKSAAILVILFMGITITGCKDSHPSGIYVCDKSKKRSDTTGQQKNIIDVSAALTCICQQFEFKGNSTVVLTVAGQQYATSYVLDKEFLRIDTDGPDFLLEMKDKNTMIAKTGFMQGTYNRK